MTVPAATILAGALALAGLATFGGCSLSSGNGMTREQGDAILAELKELRRELAEQKRARVTPGAPAAPGKVEVGDSHLQVMGRDDAPLTMVEFTDYQCPFCRRFHDQSWPQIKARYVDTGKLRYVVRDLPLSFHEQALPAAIAARCAGEQGQFWPVHEAIFNGQDALSAAHIDAIARRAGVSLPAFERCRQDPRTQAAIEADVAEAGAIGVSGTPGFVLGRRKGEKVEGALILGAQSLASFTSKIDALLAPPPAS